MVDREIAFVHRKIRVSCTQPINAGIEKAKILKDKTYDPQLGFGVHQNDLSELREKLSKLKIDNSTLGKVLDARRVELLKIIEMLKAVGSDSFSQKAISVYGRPDKELISKVKKFLELEVKEREFKYDTISSIKGFLESLLGLGFKWTVMEKEMLVGASFNIASRIIYINKNRKFSDHDLRRLIVHEIGTHIMRAENAMKQKYKIFLIGFPGYLATEEGLAVYNEERAGLLSNEVLKNYAGRVMAVELSLKNSFSTVYNELCEYFPKEQAWILALRSKRGISDTSKPGAYTKDHLYLKGWYDVKNFVKKGGRVEDLYIGKIGVEHVPVVKELIRMKIVG